MEIQENKDPEIVALDCILHKSNPDGLLASKFVENNFPRCSLTEVNAWLSKTLDIPVPSFSKKNRLARCWKLPTSKRRQLQKEFSFFKKKNNITICNYRVIRGTDNINPIIRQNRKKNSVLDYLNNNIKNVFPSKETLEQALLLAQYNKDTSVVKDIQNLMNTDVDSLLWDIKSERYYMCGGYSAQGVSKYTRQYLYPQEKGYVEIDIEACHLNIVAHKLEAQAMIALLESSEDFRNTWAQQLKVDKDCVKLALNKLIYGAKKGQLQLSFIKNKTDRDNAKDIFEKISLKKASKNELLQYKSINKRHSYIKQIVLEFLAIPAVAELRAGLKNNVPTKYHDGKVIRTKKDIWSCYCNRQEAAIMALVIKYARHMQHEVSLYQHDGCTLRLSKNNTLANITTALESYVKSNTNLSWVRFSIAKKKLTQINSVGAGSTEKGIEMNDKNTYLKKLRHRKMHTAFQQEWQRTHGSNNNPKEISAQETISSVDVFPEVFEEKLQNKTSSNVNIDNKKETTITTTNDDYDINSLPSIFDDKIKRKETKFDAYMKELSSVHDYTRKYIQPRPIGQVQLHDPVPGEWIVLIPREHRKAFPTVRALRNIFQFPIEDIMKWYPEYSWLPDFPADVKHKIFECAD